MTGVKNSLSSPTKSSQRRLRIGIVATEFPPMVGGMEQHAYGLAKALSETDDIHLFTHIRNAAAAEFAPFPIHPVLVCDLWEDVKKLSQERVDLWLTLNAGYSSLTKFLLDPVYAYCHGNDFLSPWIRQSRVDATLQKKMGQTPYLWRFAPWLSKQLVHKRLFRSLSKARIIFVNSHYTNGALLQVFPRLERPIIVSNPGVNDHFFADQRPSQVSPETDPKTLRLLTVARLSSAAPKKNVENVVHAIALLKHEILIDYKVIGDGNRRLELQALSHSLGLDDCVSFLGNVPNQQIPKFIDKADLFVLASWASKVDVESFGIVYAEAAARGVPSLMSRMGGATDAVEDGRSGIIIDGAAPQDIADGIRRFWQTRDSFKSDEIRTFADQFRWSTVAGRMRQAIISDLPF